MDYIQFLNTLVLAFGIAAAVEFLILAIFLVSGREGLTFAKARLFRRSLVIDEDKGFLKLDTVKEAIHETDEGIHVLTKRYDLNGIRTYIRRKKYIPTIDISVLDVVDKLRKAGYEAQYVVDEGIIAETGDGKPTKLPFKKGTVERKIVFSDGSEIYFYEPIDTSVIDGWLNMSMSAAAMSNLIEKMRAKITKGLTSPLSKFIEAAPALIPLLLVIGIAGYLLISKLQPQAPAISPDVIKEIVKEAVSEAVKGVSQAGQQQQPMVIK